MSLASSKGTVCIAAEEGVVDTEVRLKLVLSND